MKKKFLSLKEKSQLYLNLFAEERIGKGSKFIVHVDLGEKNGATFFESMFDFGLGHNQMIQTLERKYIYKIILL